MDLFEIVPGISIEKTAVTATALGTRIPPVSAPVPTPMPTPMKPPVPQPMPQLQTPGLGSLIRPKPAMPGPGTMAQTPARNLGWLRNIASR